MAVRQVAHRSRRLVALATLAAGLLISPQLTQADEVYVVRRYDTLSEIARDHGLSTTQLASYNGISRTTKVKVGQRLRIPEPKEASSATVAVALTPAVKKAISQARVARGRWQYLVIHHSGTPNGSAQGMDQYHRRIRHMENGLAYHFVIGNGEGMGDGQVAVGRRWKEQLDGGHLASESLNKNALGICLVGNFDKTEPTPRQIESLKSLIDALLTRCNLPRSAVRTHQQINPIYTRCPGRLFPSTRISKHLQAWHGERR